MEKSRVFGGTKGTQNTLYANAISYNSAGAMERLRLGNGKWETAKYNERLQVTQIGLGNSASDTSLLKLEFGYGNNTQNNGAMRSQKISFNGLSQPFEQTYAYDDLNRLQSATETVNNASTTTWKQTFQYDRFGNRRLDGANTTTIGVSNKVTNPLINTADNRLKKDQDGDTITDYDYDKNGNLTQDSEGKTFLYDAESHQKEVKVNGVSRGIYLYDGEGRRVKKISDLETTIFVYDGGGQLVAEYSTQQASTPQVSYLTQDHLGSPRIITDNTGKVIARKDFGAFGDETMTSQRTTALGYKPEEIRQDYTGYQKDDESGLEFAQARYYNTKHGRFTSVDPLTASANVKDPQTFNRYTYALNSPYKFTDPLGLIASSSGSGFCSASNSSCDGDGEELSTQSIDAYREAQAAAAEPPPAPTAVQNHEQLHEFALSEQDESESSLVPTIGEESETSTNDSDLPDFNSIWNNYPNADLPSLSKYVNQCAIRLSYALQKAGFDMSDFSGATDTATEGGRTYKVALRAYELWDYLFNKFGNNGNGNYLYGTTSIQPNKGDTNVSSNFGDVQGIILFRNFWGGAQGHIDLWNGKACGHCEISGSQSYFDRSKEVIILDMRSMFKRK
jgi:RHS repeat-associated protein